jgi:hypothetical protein
MSYVSDDIPCSRRWHPSRYDMGWGACAQEQEIPRVVPWKFLWAWGWAWAWAGGSHARPRSCTRARRPAGRQASSTCGALAYFLSLSLSVLKFPILVRRETHTYIDGYLLTLHSCVGASLFFIKLPDFITTRNWRKCRCKSKQSKRRATDRLTVAKAHQPDAALRCVELRCVLMTMLFFSSLSGRAGGDQGALRCGSLCRAVLGVEREGGRGCVALVRYLPYWRDWLARGLAWTGHVWRLWRGVECG